MKPCGSLKEISAETTNGAIVVLSDEYHIYGDVVIVVFKNTVALFGLSDHSDKWRRDGLIKMCLRKYAECHNDELVWYQDGQLGFGANRARNVPLKRGIYITIRDRWIFTYRPNVHVKSGLLFGADSLAIKVAAITKTHESINFETLLDECRQIGSIK